jgi:hypothetical protein
MVAVLPVCSEPLSVESNSLITGKIQGISPISGFEMTEALRLLGGNSIVANGIP